MTNILEKIRIKSDKIIHTVDVQLITPPHTTRQLHIDFKENIFEIILISLQS